MKLIERARIVLLFLSCAGLVTSAGCTAGKASGDDEPGNTTPTNSSGQDASASALPANLVLNTTSQNFGSIQLDKTSAPFTFVLTNTGGSDSGAINATVTGANGTDFKAEVKGCAKVAAKQACSIDVTFKPTAGGKRAGTLSLSSATGATLTAFLEGVGLTLGNLLATPSFKAFGSFVVGQESPEATFEIANDGDTAASGVKVKLMPEPSPHFVIVLNSCAATIASKGKCMLAVQFAPTMAGNFTSQLIVESSAGMTPISLTGRGTPLKPAALILSSIDEDFGTMVAGVAGSTPAAKDFVVRNTGEEATGALKVELTGTDKAQFALTKTCSEALPKDGMCTVSVRYRPSAVGQHTAKLDVSAMPGGTQSAQLSGIGIDKPKGALLALDAMTKTIPPVVMGEVGKIFFDITNLGDQPSGPLDVKLFGGDATLFAITSTPCTAALQPMGVCTVEISFTPNGTAERTIQLRVLATPGGTLTASIKGRGLGDAELLAARAVYDFGGLVPATAQNQVVDVLFTNIGGKAAATVTATVTGAGFTLVDAPMDCRTRQIEPAGTCNIRVRFAPAALGDVLGQLVVSVSGKAMPTVDLTGKGVEQAQSQAGLDYKYYQADWGATNPDTMETLPVFEMGVATNFDLTKRKREQNFGLVFTGYVQTPEPGTYTFYTRSDDGSRLYIDGQLLVDNWSVHASTTEEGSRLLTAGRHAIKVVYFQGGGTGIPQGMDLEVQWRLPGGQPVKIPDEVLYRSTAQPPVGTGTLVGLWRFDEQTGLVAADASSHGNTGALREFANQAGTWTTGKVSGALDFDGSNNWVKVAASTSLNAVEAANAFTLTAWARHDVAQAGLHQVVSRQVGETDREHYSLGFNDDKPVLLVGSQAAGNHTCTAPAATTIGQWVLLTGTFDGTTARLYVNGVEVCTLSRAITLVKEDTSGLVIGGNANSAAEDAGENFAGAIDELAIYSRALTAAEISAVNGGGALPTN